ncbi:MAG: PKD domain-containing protein [Methanocorpusculum sp.]|nr:PKD domain-containing protein [Methanocorpusculum sp.]
MDINGRQNTVDWSKTWMTDYYNNNGVSPYSVDDPVVAGATISIHYDRLNTTTWKPEAVLYALNITVSDAILYDGSVRAVNETGSATVRDALDAAAAAGGFTYNLSSYNTIADINGIQNAADWSKTWMTDYYNNNGTAVYSVDDPVIAGAKISIHYDILNTTTWTAEEVRYFVNITVSEIAKPTIPAVIYDSYVVLPEENLTVRHALDAAAAAGGFTYNLSSYNTIADINGIQNTADWSKTWMTDYYTNNDVVPYSVDDPVVYGAKISIHYDILDTQTFAVLGTEQMVNITIEPVANITFTHPAAITAGTPAVFTAVSSFLGNTTYTWTFGDSTTAAETKTAGTASVVSKSYSSAGSKTATVTASSDGRTAVKTVSVPVSPAPASFTKDDSTDAVLTPDAGVEIPETIKIQFSNATVNEDSGVVLKITACKNSTTLSDTEWTDLKTNLTIPNTAEKPLLVLEVNTTDTSIHTLGTYAQLIVRLNVLYADAANVSFYRYADSSSSYEPLTYTIGNCGADWTEFLVNIPGFSTIIAVADAVSSVSQPVPAVPGETKDAVTTRTITCQPITIESGTFTYTTTEDSQTYIVDNMSVFGILYASGANLKTKSWPGGIYVYAVNGIEQDANLNGWLYQVNGMTSNQMPNNYLANSGDEIIWYYSDSMSSTPETSKYAFGYAVSVKVKPVELTAASGVKISVGLPAGLTLPPAAAGQPQQISVDTQQTNTEGYVKVNGTSEIVVTRNGMQMTIQVTDGFWDSAEFRGTVTSVQTKLVGMAARVNTTGIVL